MREKSINPGLIICKRSINQAAGQISSSSANYTPKPLTPGEGASVAVLRLQGVMRVDQKEHESVYTLQLSAHLLQVSVYTRRWRSLGLDVSP